MSKSTPSSAADTWQVGDVTLTSRFLLGTAGYPSPQVLSEAIAAAGTQVVTVGLKRTLAAAGDNGHVEMIRQALRQTGAQGRERVQGCQGRDSSEPRAADCKPPQHRGRRVLVHRA